MMDDDRMELDASSASEKEEQSENGQNVNSFVLAGMIKHGIMTQQKILQLIGRTCEFFSIPADEKLRSPTGLKALVERINRDIKRCKLVVKHVRCEFSGKTYYIVMTEGENPVVRFQSTFKKQEVAAIESCVNKMLRSDTFTLSMTECVALVKKAMSKMSYADARSFVYKIIDGSYFVLTSSEESDSGSRHDEDLEVTLGCRGVLELSSAIQEKHPNALTTCKLCYKTLLHGWNCVDCGVSIHSHCFEEYIRMSKTCPGDNCSARWDNRNNLVKRKRPDPNVSRGNISGEANSESELTDSD